MVAPDETGWRSAGGKAWLWAFVGAQITVYRIAQGRGYQDAAAVLGEGYAGTIERDGWAPYRRFGNATHQTCLAHLLRRCRELVSDAVAGQAKTPHAVRRILERALALREDRDAGALDAGPLAAEVQGLEAAVDRLVAGATRYPPNRRLLNHLARERDHLFTSLVHDGVQATNLRAEHAIRPAVVTARPWAATVPGPGPTPGRPSPACCAPPASRTATHRAARPPAMGTSTDRGRPRHPRALLVFTGERSEMPNGRSQAQQE